MPLVVAKNLKIAFGSNVVIKNANFAIEAGDFVCVVGANGAGKSTLIKAILGLIKTSGGIIEFGDGLAQNEIGYLPQETRVDENFPATVEEIVLSGCLGHMGWRPFYCRHEKQHMTQSLKMLGIEKLAKKSFADLSGGQKQKVLLARSLSATTKLLILDEPSNNLDYKSRKSFYDTLGKLSCEHGLTIIMITHDLDAEDLIGDKILAIKDAEVTLTDTKSYLKEIK